MFRHTMPFLPPSPIIASFATRVGEGRAAVGNYFRRHLAPYWRRDLGFALYLAWMYCVLFGCGLATHDPSIEGAPTQWCLERIWLCAGLAQGLLGLAGVALSGRPRVRALACDPRLAWAAAACAVAGSVLVWVAWLERTVLFWRLYWAGGLLCGVAVAAFGVVWGARLGSDDEARIELAVPVSFGIAYLIYLVLLLTKLSSLFVLAVCVALAVGSAVLACRRQRSPRGAGTGGMPCEGEGPGAAGDAGWCLDVRMFDASGMAGGRAEREACANGEVRPPLRETCSLVLLTAALWFQIAYFRVISSPAVSGDRFTHYLYPFAAACAVSLVMVVLCIRVSRYLNLSLAYRWGLPMFVLSYVPLVFGYDDPQMRIVAYAINFLGMFGVQYGCWLGAAKWVRRMGCDPLRTFGGVSLGEGAGIFAGAALALLAEAWLAPDRLMAASLLVVGAVCVVVMMVGFNPDCLFRRTRARMGAGMPLGATALPEGRVTGARSSARADATAAQAVVHGPRPEPTARPGLTGVSSGMLDALDERSDPRRRSALVAALGG